ncbi:MAG: transmembrane 220 family protein [Saprospiraceae bacterium]
MKVVHIVLAVLFLLFAVVQLNDSDPYLWFGIYVAVAIAFVLKVFQRFNKILVYALLSFCVVYFLYLSPDFINWLQMGMPSITSSMQAETPHVELVREFLGLAICISALLYLIRWKR